MNPGQMTIAVTFWVCFAGVFYVYVGYPVLIYILARLFGRRQNPVQPNDEALPTLSLLIAAYNEEAVIEDRIRNALAMDYPRDKLEIVMAADGCCDATAAIAGRYAELGVRVIENEQRRGKAVALDTAIPKLRGAIVM